MIRLSYISYSLSSVDIYLCIRCIWQILIYVLDIYGGLVIGLSNSTSAKLYLIQFQVGIKVRKCPLLIQNPSTIHSFKFPFHTLNSTIYISHIISCALSIYHLLTIFMHIFIISLIGCYRFWKYTQYMLFIPIVSKTRFPRYYINKNLLFQSRICINYHNQWTFPKTKTRFVTALDQNKCLKQIK